MKKNLTALLQKGDIKPKERVMLLVHDLVSRMQTGKDALTEADRHALGSSWKPKDNNEVREYNRFLEGWRRAILAEEAEAQTIFLNAQTDHFRKLFLDIQLSFYPLYRDAKLRLESLEKIKVVDSKEAIEIFNKQRKVKLDDGQDLDYTIYLFAFESLSEDLQKDLKELYEEVEYDHEYLDQEEIIADLFNGKDTLTKEAKEKLAELVAERSYNDFAGEYQIYHYFADIPILEVAGRWAKEKGIKPTKKYTEREEKAIKEVAKKEKISEDEAKEKLFLENDLKDVLGNYARDNKTTTGAILKEACLKWLDEGLLTNIYTPLFNSDKKNTYGEDTKYPHNEIFREWLKAKKKARATLQELIDKGELKVVERKQDETRFAKRIKKQREGIGKASELYKGEAKQKAEADNKPYKVITGESLYNFKGDFKFIKEFKERVDRYDANLGILYADDDPEHRGDHLDRELLVADKTKEGKPAIFSLFGMAIKRITAIFEHTHFIREEKGELTFRDNDYKDFYKERRDGLVENYTKLLAFEEIFKRLSKTYEIDLTFRIKKWLEYLGDYIDHHNSSLKKALEGYGELDDNPLYLKYKLTLKENLFIDKEKIKPDQETLESNIKTFKDILGDDF